MTTPKIVLVGLLLATAGTSTYNGVCRRQYTVAVFSTTNGTRLHFSSSAPDNFTLEIPRFLPTRECGENYELCDVLLIEMESEVIVFVPSQGGFVMVTYRGVGERPQYMFYPVNLDEGNCHPVKAFRSFEHNNIVITCIELLSNNTSGSPGLLFLVPFSLTQQKIMEHYGMYVLHSWTTSSEAVHANDKIFFTDNGELLKSYSDVTESLDPTYVIDVKVCNQTQAYQIDVTENKVSIYCSLNDSWTILATSLDHTHHTYYRYPCPGPNQYVRVDNGRRIFIGNTTQEPFVGELPDDIAYGACLGSENSFEFWAFTVGGQLLRFPLTTDSHHTMTNLSACTSEENICLRPSFDASKTCGAYFNPETNQVHIMNLTSSCGHRTVDMPGTPHLFKIALGEKEDNCSCANELPTSLPNSVVLWALWVIPVVVFLVAIIICVVIYRKCDCSHFQRPSILKEDEASDCSDNTYDHKKNSSSDNHEQIKLESFGASNNVYENPPATRQVDYDYGPGQEVQANKVIGDKDAGFDVVGGHATPHSRANMDPQTVADNSNAKNRGEENENRNLNITGRLS